MHLAQNTTIHSWFSIIWYLMNIRYLAHHFVNPKYEGWFALAHRQYVHHIMPHEITKHFPDGAPDKSVLFGSLRCCVAPPSNNIWILFGPAYCACTSFHVSWFDGFGVGVFFLQSTALLCCQFGLELPVVCGSFRSASTVLVYLGVCWWIGH